MNVMPVKPPKGARGEQRPGRAGQARRQRREREDDEAGHERAAAAVEIACASADQQERSERERVGGHDPLQVRSRGAELAFDRRQGDRHDHAVEHHEQVGGAQQRQHRGARRSDHADRIPHRPGRPKRSSGCPRRARPVGDQERPVGRLRRRFRHPHG
jgi:hypothetical protein